MASNTTRAVQSALNYFTNTYALITTVHNESMVLERCIKSVIAQTLLPIKWVIICDRCTDGTEALARSMTSNVSWIHVLTSSTSSGAGYENKVCAIRTALASIDHLNYAFLGILDGDIELQPNFYSRLIARMQSDALIGIAGGMVLEPELHCELVIRSTEVPGGTQVFRRSCFETIGGFLGIPEGGEDAVACAMARMAGYKTVLYSDLTARHLKPRGGHTHGYFKHAWHGGQRDGAIGYYMPYVIAKCMFRGIKEKRYLYYSIWFVSSMMFRITNRQPRMPANVVAFIQQEQRRLLWERVRTFLAKNRTREFIGDCK